VCFTVKEHLRVPEWRASGELAAAVWFCRVKAGSDKIPAVARPSMSDDWTRSFERFFSMADDLLEVVTAPSGAGPYGPADRTFFTL
jgi:hypothetical protein